MPATLHPPVAFRDQWRELKRSRPGQRFQNRYHRARQNKSSAGKRIAWIAAAVVCIAIGIVLMVIPGPAILFFLAAGGVLATESLAVARALDWSELRLRGLLNAGKRAWARLPAAGGIILVVLAVGLFLALAWLAFRLWRG